MKNARNNIAAVIGVMAATLGLVACSGASSPTPSTPGAATETSEPLVIAITASPGAGWDPLAWIWAASQPYEEAAYETLTRLGEDGEVTPALATSWEYLSDTEFQIDLREGVTFTDGTSFDAEAVKANLERIPTTPGPSTGALRNLTEVEVVSESQVIVHSSSYIQDLPSLLGRDLGMMVSPAAIADPTLLANGPVGAGPYLLDQDQTIVDDTYVWTKNPDYWDADSILFANLTIRIISDEQTAYSAFQSGQVDMTWSKGVTLDAAKAAGFNILETPGRVRHLQIMDMAGEKIPALADVRVRQAMNYAIDRESYSENVLAGRPTSQFASSDSNAYDADLDDMYTYDVDKAKDLMADAGYADGFTLPLLVASNAEQDAEIFASDLAAIGITVEINSKTIPEYVAAANGGEFSVIYSQSTQSGNPAVDLPDYLLSTGVKNPFHYADQAVVDQIEVASTETDADEATKQWQEVSRLVTEAAQFVVLEQDTGAYYYNDKVTNVTRPSGYPVPTIRTLTPAT